MAIELTPTNIFQFFSTILPFLLVFFMVMISIFNQNIKGLVYLGGILMATILNVLFQNVIKNPSYADSAPTCNLFDIPGNNEGYNNPSLSSLLIGFTIAYLVLPMSSNKQMNISILIALFSLFTMDSISKVMNKCTSYAGVLLGGSLGFLLGSGWYALLHASGQDSLLYFDEVNSNNVVCSRPSKQKFKCSVYKNGQLIKDL
jgi:hypothetical protein